MKIVDMMHHEAIEGESAKWV